MPPIYWSTGSQWSARAGMVGVSASGSSVYVAGVLKHSKALITPHISSRTYESVPRQAMRATLNLVNYLKGEKDVIQANKF